MDRIILGRYNQAIIGWIRKDQARAAIRRTEAFFNELEIDTKLSKYTKQYEGTAEEISKRFRERGWIGLGEHKKLQPEDIEEIVRMAY